MSRAERRADRRRSHYRAGAVRTGGTSRPLATGRARSAARRQQRLAVILLAVIGLLGLAVVATPMLSAAPGQ